MQQSELISLYLQSSKTKDFAEKLSQKEIVRAKVNGLCGSSRSVFAAACALSSSQPHLFVLQDKETAAFFFGDLEQLLQEEDTDFSVRQSVFFPESPTSQQQTKKSDNFDVLLRTKMLQRLQQGKRLMVVTYPEALMQKVITKQTIEKETFTISRGEQLSVDFILEFLSDNNFEYSDFVFQPGQFSIRGGIVDVFSYTNEFPFRIEFLGDKVASLRTFEIETQLSKSRMEKIVITPNLQQKKDNIFTISLFDSLPQDTVLWFEDISWTAENICKKQDLLQRANESSSFLQEYITEKDFKESILKFSTVEWSPSSFLNVQYQETFGTQPQMLFNKQFDLLIDQWIENYELGIQNIFSSLNENQSARIRNIVRDSLSSQEKYRIFPEEYCKKLEKEMVTYVSFALHEGFIDKEQKIAFYTDHQVFNRYHRYKVDDRYKKSDSILLKEIYDLKSGDYITHIDHGVGQFAGLEKIEINGKQQEAIKIIYKGNDILYISIQYIKI